MAGMEPKKLSREKLADGSVLDKAVELFLTDTKLPKEVKP